MDVPQETAGLRYAQHVGVFSSVRKAHKTGDDVGVVVPQPLPKALAFLGKRGANRETRKKTEQHDLLDRSKTDKCIHGRQHDIEQCRGRHNKTNKRRHKQDACKQPKGAHLATKQTRYIEGKQHTGKHRGSKDANDAGQYANKQNKNKDNHRNKLE